MITRKKKLENHGYAKKCIHQEIKENKDENNSGKLFFPLKVSLVDNSSLKLLF